MIGTAAKWIGTRRALRGASKTARSTSRAARSARGQAKDAGKAARRASQAINKGENVGLPTGRGTLNDYEAWRGKVVAERSARKAARDRSLTNARKHTAKANHRRSRKEIVGGVPGKLALGAAVGGAMVAGAASETFNPEGYAGDITEDLTGSRDFQAQMFGASLRTQFTASQPRMGRPGRRRPQAPPGDIVFGMYNLR